MRLSQLHLSRTGRAASWQKGNHAKLQITYLIYYLPDWHDLESR